MAERHNEILKVCYTDFQVKLEAEGKQLTPKVRGGVGKRKLEEDDEREEYDVLDNDKIFKL